MIRFDVPEGIKIPWATSMGEVPQKLEYFEGTMWEKVEQAASQYPDAVAYDFMGKKTKYKTFVEQVSLCARALKAIGIRNGARGIHNALHAERRQPRRRRFEHDPSAFQPERDRVLHS